MSESTRIEWRTQARSESTIAILVGGLSDGRWQSYYILEGGLGETNFLGFTNLQKIMHN